MVLVLRKDITEEEIKHICEKLEKWGMKPVVSRGVEKTVIGAIGEEDVLRSQPLEAIPGVESVVPILKPYKIASREYKKENTTVSINGIVIGGKKIVVAAGPCSVETEDLLVKTAVAVKKAGASMLRGGAFKPRTSPYSFQGLGEQGLKFLAEAKKITGLPIVTEVMDARQIEVVVRYADVIQIGARNMQNFELLKEIGKTKSPIILKRGMMSTIEEFLMSAEYILSQGNLNVILCERGIRTFERAMRNTLDLACVPVLKSLSHLPVIVDPSHGTGHWRWVSPLSSAAVAVGADGLLVEVHPSPEDAYSDGEQSLLPEKFSKMLEELRPVARAVNREI